MKRRRTATALISVGLVLSGGCTSESNPGPEETSTPVTSAAPDAPDRFFPPVVRQALDRRTEDVLTYWNAKGVVTNLGNFVLLEGDATIPNYCKNPTFSDSYEPQPPKDVISSSDRIMPLHCARKDKVVITPAGLELVLPKGISLDSREGATVGALILSHESGHHAQLVEGRYKTMAEGNDERQADCYAGVMTALYSPEDYSLAPGFYDFKEKMSGFDMMPDFDLGFNDVAGAGQACDTYQ